MRFFYINQASYLNNLAITETVAHYQTLINPKQIKIYYLKWVESHVKCDGPAQYCTLAIFAAITILIGLLYILRLLKTN